MNINLLTEVEVESLNRLIDEANHIAIYTHRSPDGDAIGSTLGMANYLKQRGHSETPQQKGGGRSGYPQC